MQTALIHIFIIKFILDFFPADGTKPQQKPWKLHHRNKGTDCTKLTLDKNIISTEHFSLILSHTFKCIIILSMKMAVIQLLLLFVCCDCILRSHRKTAALFVIQKPIWADTQSRYIWELSIIKALFITALHQWSTDSVHKRLIWMNLEYKIKTLKINNQAH